jgi:XisI protein
MDKLELYRQHIYTILDDYRQIHLASGHTDFEVIIDKEGDHYQFVNVGWDEQRRNYGTVLHLDIKDGKIWIQHDGTEEGVANRLVALGVPKSDIVLAFHSPFKRKFTEYAVG